MEGGVFFLVDSFGHGAGFLQVGFVIQWARQTVGLYCRRRQRAIRHSMATSGECVPLRWSLWILRLILLHLCVILLLFKGIFNLKSLWGKGGKIRLLTLPCLWRLRAGNNILKQFIKHSKMRKDQTSVSLKRSPVHLHLLNACPNERFFITFFSGGAKIEEELDQHIC